MIQSKRIRGEAGEPLPTVWKSLEGTETYFYRGQLVLVAAGPGTGKSGLVLTQALLSGVTCLYFSADSDAFVQLSRAVAIMSGCTLAEAARAVRDDDLSRYHGALVDTPIRFRYDASPDLDMIETSLDAYYELYGEYPQLVVVDNVTNVRTESGTEEEDPFSGLEGLMDYLHGMARETQACVIGLHHVTGGYNDATRPIPLSGVKGQITRVPEMVLTLHRIDDSLRVSTVKNRSGKADPGGETFADLDFNGDRMRITDPPWLSERGHLWETPNGSS